MKTFLIERPVIRREFIVAERLPQVGEVISSRHPGLFDAEVSDEDPPAAPAACPDCPPVGPVFYSLQESMWLLDRPARWFADMVRKGELTAYARNGKISFLNDDLKRLLSDGFFDQPTDDWCCRVESVEAVATGETEAVVHAQPCPGQTLSENPRQLIMELWG